jgi:hypothetical protein
MTIEELNHVEQHSETLKAWVGVHAKLQYSDITKPIFHAFERETSTLVSACDDCKIDAVRWALTELNKTKQNEGKTNKKK